MSSHPSPGPLTAAPLRLMRQVLVLLLLVKAEGQGTQTLFVCGD